MPKQLETVPGVPGPLGATWDGSGVNFAVYSANAAGLELCLFEAEVPHRESRRARMTKQDGNVWSVRVENIGPGTLYGFRATGPWNPSRGLRFNHHKLMIDPYAKALKGKVDWSQPVFDYKLGRDGAISRMDLRNDAHGIPKSVVIDPAFDWGDDSPPRTPKSESIIYEAHVKGLTMRHPDVPEEIKGTYAGLAHPAITSYLNEIGITAIELLPVHSFVDDDFLVKRDLVNYWGYNTIGFFAPDARYASRDSGEQVNEFKAMVKAFHAAGIEVLLDVVFNHTAEGGALGPTFAFRGLDNLTYYRLVDEDPGIYLDLAGTGNSVDVFQEATRNLVLDSLRYWATEMHVDGFRFDLAPVLGREHHEFNTNAEFFQQVAKDPVLSKVKMIAEPWDVADGGYQVGNFPAGWSEWNDHYRDTVRRFWRSDDAVLGDFGSRITGSADLFADPDRRPDASVNFVVSHDGYTLRDLVTYNDKHNEANGEDNQDGFNNNNSYNYGVEGPTEDGEINAIRHRQIKNMIGMLAISHGIPMIAAGDETGRTQYGNNNAYCQDNETSWVNWELDVAAQDILAYSKAAIALRKGNPTLRADAFFTGNVPEGGVAPDISWLRPDTDQMTAEDWNEPGRKALSIVLCPATRDDIFYIAVNAYPDQIQFTFPGIAETGGTWSQVLSTEPVLEGGAFEPGSSHTAEGRALLVYRFSQTS